VEVKSPEVVPYEGVPGEKEGHKEGNVFWSEVLYDVYYIMSYT
jgi:hypothetical protein